MVDVFRAMPVTTRELYLGVWAESLVEFAVGSQHVGDFLFRCLEHGIRDI